MQTHLPEFAKAVAPFCKKFSSALDAIQTTLIALVQMD
jgi:hypothetical protein